MRYRVLWKRLIQTAVLAGMSVFLAVPALAAGGEPNLSMTINRENVNVDGTVTVTVLMDGSDVQLASFAGGILFDKNYFECVEVTDGNGDDKPIAVNTSANWPDTLDPVNVRATVDEANAEGVVGFAMAQAEEGAVSMQQPALMKATFKATQVGNADFYLFEDSDGTDGFISDQIDASKKTVKINEKGTGYEVSIVNKESTANPIEMTITEGRYSGEVSFTVTAPDKQVCVVAYTTDGGKTYNRIPVGAGIGNTRSFTLDVEEDMELFCGFVGDATLDGKTNSTDAKQIMRYIVGVRTFSREQELVADVTGEGKTNSTDAKQIMRFTVGAREFSWK